METTLEKMQQFTAELNAYLQDGKTLREIMQITYNRREAGENIPYMAIGTSEKGGNVLDLFAAPTAKQKELKSFFTTPREGRKFLPITLFMDCNGAILKL